MNVNQKGVKGLIKVIDDLTDKGYYTFPAFDDHSPVDLVAMRLDGRVVRLQVKYRSLEGPSYKIPVNSVVNGKRVPIDRTLIDGWAVYLKDCDRVVYVPTHQLNHITSTYSIRPATVMACITEWK